MKNLAIASLLLVMACGSDVTSYIVDDGAVVCGSESHVSWLPQSESYRQALPRDEDPDAGPTARASAEIAKSGPIPLVLTVSPNLVPVVEAITDQLGTRLGLPIVIGEGGVSIYLKTGLQVGGVPVDGKASYKKVCTFSGCNGQATIGIESKLLEVDNPKHDYLYNVVLHEIGHVLSGWGIPLHVDQHLSQPGHVMSAASGLGYWTWEDAEFWCSGSPCEADL